MLVKVDRGWLILMRRILLAFGLLVATLLGISPANAEEEVRIGVLAKRGATLAEKQWQPTAAYLSNAISGYTFKLVPLDFDAIVPSIKSGTIDFILTNPSFYVELEMLYGVSRIVTIKNNVNGQSSTQFGGVIFTRADNPHITTLKDLKGKRFMAVQDTSLGGYQMALDLMRQTGIEPIDDFAHLQFGGTHDAVVNAVLNGIVDAGTVRTDTLERMAQEGTIDLAQIRIINAQNFENYPFLVSTPLYPEWPLARLKKISNELSDRIAAVLLAIPPNSAAANAGRYMGWSVAHNYQLVHKLLKNLRVGPYAYRDHVLHLEEIFDRYWHWLVLFLLVLLVLGSTIIYVSSLNRRLLYSGAALQVAHDTLELRVNERTQELVYHKYALDQHSIVDVTDLAGLITYTNDKFSESSGYSRDELLGNTHSIVKSGIHSREFFAELMSTICAGEIWVGEICNRSKNGDIYWVDTTIVPHINESGLPDRYISIRTDITEIKRTDEQLHLQVSALKAAADGIVITNRKGDIQWVNPAYCKLTGFDAEEIVGQNTRVLKSGKQDQAYYKRLWETIISGKTWHGELCNQHKDGTLYMEEETITPVVNQDGEIAHFIAIKRDITERKQLQKQLLQAQKMESVGELTGGIAHDFNNMLVSIMGFTELARRKVSQYQDEQIESYLSQVYSAGCRARDLIAQMLAFSRGGEGEFEPLMLTPLINESLKMLGVTLPSSIEIELQLDGGDLTVMTNPVQLHQLIMNLCINARDAMQGKGHITIGLRHMKNVVVNCHSCHDRNRGDFIKLFIRDSGSGIHQDQLERIFDPFYTTKEVGKGTGMGLSMVHGIMHDHGGHIVVDTELGRGTTFNLLFPVMDDQIETVSMGDVDAATSFDQICVGKILIVDDEVSVGHFIGELLKEYGCQVTVETDSRSALSRFKDNPEAYDLVVTDQTMPHMTGIELAQSLIAIRKELPVILCTGYSEHINESRARSLGFRGYVNKPIETDEFLKLVKELLQA